MLTILSLLFGLSTINSAPLTTAQVIPLEKWVPAMEDRFIADTEANQGYIVHTDGSYTTFRIGSGRKETIHYLKRTYKGDTPEEMWTVQSTTIQTDRNTFGKDGLFLRLYSEGKKTHYGIHATSNINEILAGDDRFKSLGCILVSYDVLEILTQTYLLNGKKLEVATVQGLPQTINKSVLAKSL